jgi:hypothetical protein
MKTESFQAPSDPEKLIVWANKKFDDGSKISEFHGKQNLAFLKGEQWGVWDDNRRRFNQASTRRGDPNAPVRVTVNKIGSLVERVIARLLKDVPTPACRPVTDTASDVNAAKVGTRILDHELTARLKLQQRLTELYFWVLPLGWSFMHVRWDPKIGKVVGTDPKGNQVRQGDVVLDEVPAFEIRLDPNARRWREAWWCVREVAMTKEAVFEQYGIVPDVADAESMADEWRALSDGDTPKLDGKKTAQGRVAVRQLWLRPGGRAVPKGLVFTWAGKTVLEKPMDFPYEHGDLPFVPFNLLPAVGGSPEGRTWVSDLVAIQRDYNDARSREAMIRRVLTPKVLAARGQIDPNRLTSRVEIIDYNPTGPKPELMLPDGRWMAQFEQAMNRADTEMGDRAGQQDVSQGKTASTAAAASIMALQEADESKLAISSGEMRASIQDLGHQVLMLVKQFWSEERAVRTWSRDGELEVSHFSGSDLGEQLDVHISTESTLPRSKSARTQLAVDLWQQGIVSDPRHFVRLLDVPGTDFLVETLNLDAKQAEREHGHLIEMEPVEAAVWHNHVAHVATHDEFRKSEEYEQLEPNQKAWFDGHVQAHFQIIASQQAAMAMPPGGNAPGGPETTNPSGENGQMTDPTTGMPSDPNQMMGATPTDLQGGLVSGPGGIGGAGNPGAVPGQSMDSLAGHLGN